MNKYVIDYGFGHADFYTEATEPRQVEEEFYKCANCCFGIRKSLLSYRVIELHTRVELPIPYRGHGGTHFLSHHGDEILFDFTYECDGHPWKLHSEFKDWCSCSVRGVPEKSCSVHQAYVPEEKTPDQDKVEVDKLIAKSREEPTNYTSELVEALEEIAEWPNGGNRYGQQNIKQFAREVLAKVRGES